jgi:tripartite-type tricarboxylate transporter receptor subunit TctC
MKPYVRTGAAALVLLSSAALAAPTAEAQTPYYQGKTVRLVVGFTPGGGYDTYARLLSRHFGNHIPGKPNVIVENMPGAGSLTAVRWLDGPAPKDGTAIAVYNPGLITQSLLEPEKMNNLKFTDFAWVGNIARDQRVCYVWHTKAVKDFDEFRKKSWVFGTTGVGAANWINQRTLQRVFNIDLKIITGFPGSPEQRLAIERGELDGDCGSWTSIPEDHRKNNLVRPFVKLSKELPPDAPKNVPWANDLAANDEDRAVLNVINGAGEIGRPYMLSKQVPAAQVAIMRKAFDDTMKDPAFLADGAKAQLPIDPMTADEVLALLQVIYNAPPAALKRAKEVTE